jgi:hypothetical protein
MHCTLPPLLLDPGGSKEKGEAMPDLQLQETNTTVTLTAIPLSVELVSVPTVLRLQMLSAVPISQYQS